MGVKAQNKWRRRVNRYLAMLRKPETRQFAMAYRARFRPEQFDRQLAVSK